MKKLIGIACAAAMVAAPGMAAAKQDGSTAHKDAVKTCKELRKAAGKKAFAELYGKKGIGHCIKQETRENKAEEKAGDENAEQKDQNQVSAAAQCRAERKADPEAFAATYGTNPNKRNAFGKCVSKKAHEMNEEPEGEQQA
jgi:hypothetical protein